MKITQTGLITAAEESRSATAGWTALKLSIKTWDHALKARVKKVAAFGVLNAKTMMVITALKIVYGLRLLNKCETEPPRFG